jgi:LAO/AO transport system kinase
LLDGILAGNRMWLARAITLTESQLPSDRALAEALINAIMPHTGKSFRLGITGVPGVGKSTLIEHLGLYMIDQGYSPAILAVDPTSKKTGGAILGDKTRMEKLSVHPAAYIRPSAAGKALGGVQQHTREAILLCEAAGFDLILVETVGVGQSELEVHGMVDCFVLLMLAGAGDELQGIKRGIMEMADILVITKADAEDPTRIQVAKGDYTRALHLLPPPEGGWKVPVLTVSAVQNKGLSELLEAMQAYRLVMVESGMWKERRERQSVAWLEESIHAGFLQALAQQGPLLQQWNEAVAKVKQQQAHPGQLGRSLFKALLERFEGLA